MPLPYPDHTGGIKPLSILYVMLLPMDKPGQTHCTKY